MKFNVLSLACVTVLTVVFSSGCQSLATHRMLAVERFTFGPIGYGTGRTSEGEDLYNTILRAPTAVDDFEYVWEHGNAQARAYALTAFWKLDRARFERDAAEFIREKPIVFSQHVDTIGTIPASWVVEGIRNGVPSFKQRGHLPRQLTAPWPQL